MAKKSNVGKTMWSALGSFAGTFAVAYLLCAIHDDYRMRRGEPDRCVLPAIRAALGQVLGFRLE